MPMGEFRRLVILLLWLTCFCSLAHAAPQPPDPATLTPTELLRAIDPDIMNEMDASSPALDQLLARGAAVVPVLF